VDVGESPTSEAISENIMSKLYTVQTIHPINEFPKWFADFRKNQLRISKKKWQKEWKKLGITWTNYPPNKVTLQFKSKRRANRVAKHFLTEVKEV